MQLLRVKILTGSPAESRKTVESTLLSYNLFGIQVCASTRVSAAGDVKKPSSLEFHSVISLVEQTSPNQRRDTSLY